MKRKTSEYRNKIRTRKRHSRKRQSRKRHSRKRHSRKRIRSRKQIKNLRDEQYQEGGMKYLPISGSTQSELQTKIGAAKDAIESNPRRSTTAGVLGLGGLSILSPVAGGIATGIATASAVGMLGKSAYTKNRNTNTGYMTDAAMGRMGREDRKIIDPVPAKEAAKQAEEVERLLAEEELKSMSFADMIVAIRARGVGEEKIRAAEQRDDTDLREELIRLLDLKTVTTDLEREGLMERGFDELKKVAMYYGMSETEADKLRPRDKKSVNKVLAQILTKQ